MTYRNDKARIEAALMPCLMLSWMRAMTAREHERTGEVAAHNQEVMDALKQATMDPLDGLDPAKHEKVQRRLDRVYTAIMREYNEHSAAKVFMAIAMLWRDLIAAGKVAHDPESRLGEAYEAIKNEVCDVMGDELDNMDRSAERSSVRMLAGLNREGYFR